MKIEHYSIDRPIKSWQVLGLAFPKGAPGEIDSHVTGDPCIVMDEENDRWLMYYFAAGDKLGTTGITTGVAVSKSKTQVGAGDWIKQGVINISNPNDVWQNSPHKPWFLMDPYRPNHAVKVNGKYQLFFISKIGLNCVIQRAQSECLSGPWEVQKQPVLRPDTIDGFDSYHTDTVTAYWFEEKGKILLFYKGYPQCEQKDQPKSPYGSSTACAVLDPSEFKAKKLGRIMRPHDNIRHWSSGWNSGLQLIPKQGGGWYGLTTASPTPPDSLWNQLYMREPNPSLGGWAWCDEAFPSSGWHIDDEPISWIHTLSKEQTDLGQRVNLFRHHLLILEDGTRYLYYNSGPYFDEQLFVHVEKN